MDLLVSTPRYSNGNHGGHKAINVPDGITWTESDLAGEAMPGIGLFGIPVLQGLRAPAGSPFHLPGGRSISGYHRMDVLMMLAEYAF